MGCAWANKEELEQDVRNLWKKNQDNIPSSFTHVTLRSTIVFVARNWHVDGEQNGQTATVCAKSGASFALHKTVKKGSGRNWRKNNKQIFLLLNNLSLLYNIT